MYKHIEYIRDVRYGGYYVYHIIASGMYYLYMRVNMSDEPYDGLFFVTVKQICWFHTDTKLNLVVHEHDTTKHEMLNQTDLNINDLYEVDEAFVNKIQKIYDVSKLAFDTRVKSFMSKPDIVEVNGEYIDHDYFYMDPLDGWGYIIMDKSCNKKDRDDDGRNQDHVVMVMQGKYEHKILYSYHTVISWDNFRHYAISKEDYMSVAAIHDDMCNKIYNLLKEATENHVQEID